VTPKHQRPLRDVHRLAPGTRLALEFYVEDRVLEGVWLNRRTVNPQLGEAPGRFEPEHPGGTGSRPDGA
jgi:hypothetical protein